MKLRESGIHYGPFFQSIAQLWRHNGDVLSEVQVAEGLMQSLPPINSIHRSGHLLTGSGAG
jgi:hypothetical protein